MCYVLGSPHMLLYEEESANRTQMDIKRKVWYSNQGKKHLFLDMSSTNIDILVPSLCQCIETRSIEVNSLLSQSIPHLHFIICDFRTSLREFLDPAVNRFTLQTLPTVNGKIFCMNILCIESLLHTKTCNKTLIFGIILLKHSRHFDYWNRPLNMRMHFCFLDCHEARLWCYLVIEIENLVSP
jgi:hypothetical protein